MFDDIFRPFGLYINKSYSNDIDSTSSWVGIKTNSKTLIINNIINNSPAYTSGINVNDELIAVNNIRLNTNNYKSILKSLSLKEHSNLLINRDGLLKNIIIKPIKMPFDDYTINKLDKVSEKQKNLYRNWLGVAWDEKKDN